MGHGHESSDLRRSAISCAGNLRHDREGIKSLLTLLSLSIFPRYPSRNEGNPLLQIEVEPTSDVSLSSFPFVYRGGGASGGSPVLGGLHSLFYQVDDALTHHLTFQMFTEIKLCITMS